MFERYTEKARRVVFFARYEASQFGSPFIETEHLLLGLLREDEGLNYRVFRSHAAVETVRDKLISGMQQGQPFSTAVDLPLSNACKRVLAYAAEEAERLQDKHIGTEHILLGLMREKESTAAQVLEEHGLELLKLREQLAAFKSGEVREGWISAGVRPEVHGRIEFLHGDKSLG